jgi:seryl-tRNA synthetase
MKNLLKGRILLLIVFLLGSAVLFSAYTNVGYLNKINWLQNELQVKAKQNAELDNKLFETEKTLKNQITTLNNKLETADKKLESLPKLEEFEIEQLKQKGLKDPVKDLKLDLMKRKDLIPYKGVLGGTMNFYSEENIYIISSKWAVAHFDDGHINGIILLEYKVQKDGKIRWYVVDSFLY